MLIVGCSQDFIQFFSTCGGDRWNLLKDYKMSRSTKIISAATSFPQYEEYKERIQNELVGIETVDKRTVLSQSKHFIERVFGTTEDPHTRKPRSGVEIEDVAKCLLSGKQNSTTHVPQ